MDYLSKEQICNIYTCTMAVLLRHRKNKTLPEPKYIASKSGGKLALYLRDDIEAWAEKYGFLNAFDNLLANKFVSGHYDSRRARNHRFAA